MTIAIGDEHVMLHGAASRFCEARCSPAVARAAMDGPADESPPFWSDLATTGWLGLAVPEALGGEGYGIGELAVVLEALGRAGAPGPALPTTWAASVLAGQIHGLGPTEGDESLGATVADLAAGRRIGTVALTGSLVAATAADATAVRSVDRILRLSGRAGPLLCGAMADLALVPALVDGEERWFLVDLADADVEAVASLDPTRPLAGVDLVDTPAVVLDGVDRAAVESVGVVLAAAEAAGVAAWCVDTAAAYARERRQFGRPIGQFQAVKHRCADMLARLEQIRSVAWDAAAALDGEDPLGAEARVAVAAAGAISLDASVEVAKDCIQVLGGIGFTWEHDAHLYLRRATAVRQLLGGPERWRAEAATSALAGTRRHLRLDLPEEAGAARDEIAVVVDRIAALPDGERRAALADAGLIVPHWAAPWGRDATAVEQLVIDDELRRVRVRVPHLMVGAWAAPTIAAHGTVEQQERWVRSTLRGEITWCQLFSEPEAGSDLAALTTAATRTDGGWLLNGQKVWTTMAHEADWGICLARTNPTAPKHLGITYFVVDMSAAGIDIRPLRELTGMEMFNEVFLDDVFVPDDAVIGEVDGGWPLARTTLANERVSMGNGSSFGGGIEALLGMVSARVERSDLALDPVVLDRLGALVVESHALAVLGLRSTMRSVVGAKPGPEASIRKLLGVEHDQATQELGLTLLGPEGATTVGDGGQWTFGFLANRCLTIAGGTSEIQRNVIGERLLGLPRDPEPA